MPRARTKPRLEEYNPEIRSFEAWLTTILSNLFKDRLRAHIRSSKRKRVRWDKYYNDAHKDKNRKKLIGRLHESLLAREHSLESAGLDELTPWSARDQALINSWPCTRRIVLLALSGLCVKCSSEEWEAMIVEYEQLHQTKLSRPFPSEDVLSLPTPGDRIQALSKQLHIKPNTLSQQWHRWNEALKSLEFIRQLYDAR